MLLGTLGTSLLGNILSGQRINKKGRGIIRAGEEVTKSTRQGQEIVRADYGRLSPSASHNKNNKANF